MYKNTETGIDKQTIGGEEVTSIDVSQVGISTEIKSNALFIYSLDGHCQDILAMTIVTESENNKRMLKEKMNALLFALQTGFSPIVRIGAMLLDFSNVPDLTVDNFIESVNEYVAEKPKRHNMIIGRHLKNVGQGEDIILSDKKYTWYMNSIQSNKISRGSIVVVKTSKGFSEVLVEKTYRLDEGKEGLISGEFKQVVNSRISKARTGRLKARIVTDKKKLKEK